MASVRRRNGWQAPFNRYQFAVWVIFPLIFIHYFAFIYALLRTLAAQVAVTVVFVLAFGVAVVAGVVCSTMDPADNYILSGAVDDVDATSANERVYCYLCEVNVGLTSKHCRYCDKCIVGFDHHCVWLNTCIGTKNYLWFFTAVTSSALFCTTSTVLSLALLIDVCSAPARVAALPYFSSTIGVAGVQALLVLSLLAFAGWVAMIYQLWGFHVYLLWRGIGTYDFIVEQQQKKAARVKAMEGVGGDGSDGRAPLSLANATPALTAPPQPLPVPQPAFKGIPASPALDSHKPVPSHGYGSDTFAHTREGGESKEKEGGESLASASPASSVAGPLPNAVATASRPRQDDRGSDAEAEVEVDEVSVVVVSGRPRRPPLPAPTHTPAQPSTAPAEAVTVAATVAVEVQKVDKGAARRQVAAAIHQARSASASLRTTPAATPGVSPTKRGPRTLPLPFPPGWEARVGTLPPLVPLGAVAAGMPPVSQMMFMPAAPVEGEADDDDDDMRPI